MEETEDRQERGRRSRGGYWKLGRRRLRKGNARVKVKRTRKSGKIRGNEDKDEEI